MTALVDKFPELFLQTLALQRRQGKIEEKEAQSIS